MDTVSRIFAVSGRETFNRLIHQESKELLLGKQDFYLSIFEESRSFSS